MRTWFFTRQGTRQRRAKRASSSVRTRRVQIWPDKQRVRSAPLSSPTATDTDTQEVHVVITVIVIITYHVQDVDDHRDVANGGVMRKGSGLSAEQYFHIRLIPYRAVALKSDPVHPPIAHSGGGGSSLDIPDAHASAVRHVPALEEHSARTERAQLPRSAQHSFDRGYRCRHWHWHWHWRRATGVEPEAALALHEEQRRRLGRVGREHRREGEELLDERVERVVLGFEERVAGRRHADRVEHQRGPLGGL